MSSLKSDKLIIRNVQTQFQPLIFGEYWLWQCYMKKKGMLKGVCPLKVKLLDKKGGQNKF